MCRLCFGTDSSTRTENSVTTTTNLTHHRIILGLLVRSRVGSLHLDLTLLAVLDPRISYEGLKADFSSDPDLLDHLEDMRSQLNSHFQAKYAGKFNPKRATAPAPSTSSFTHPKGSPQKDFTARYRLQQRTVIDELQEYFKLPQEDFDLCDPIQWWFSRQAQFPKNLFCLARDILTIPGRFFLAPLDRLH